MGNPYRYLSVWVTDWNGHNVRLPKAKLKELEKRSKLEKIKSRYGRVTNADIALL